MVKNLAATVRYLEEEMGRGRDGPAKAVTKFPSVLGFSVDDHLATKGRFLAEAAGAGREGAADIILAYPTLRCLSENFPDTNAAEIMYLATYSLAGRLEPRVRCCRGTARRGGSPPRAWLCTHRRSSANQWASRWRSTTPRWRRA